MRFTFVAAVASLLATTQARIVEMGTPSQIKPGDDFTVTLVTENYIQSVEDVAFCIGCAPGHGYPDSLGIWQKCNFIGPELSNQLHNVSFQVTAPETFPLGPALCTGVLFNLLGAVYGPSDTIWTLDVTFGNETSDDIVISQP